MWVSGRVDRQHFIGLYLDGLCDECLRRYQIPIPVPIAMAAMIKSAMTTHSHLGVIWMMYRLGAYSFEDFSILPSALGNDEL